MRSSSDVMWARLPAILLASLILVGAFSAAIPTSVVASEGEPRKVILELITATWCVTCPYADEAADDLSRMYGPERFSVLQYHVSLDGLDTPETNARRDDYNAGQTGLPAAWFDGTEGVHSVGEQNVEFFHILYEESIKKRLKSQSPISISVTLTESVDEVKVTASFSKSRDILVPDNIYARYVLFENSVTYNGPVYNYVVRDVEVKDFHYPELPYDQQVTFALGNGWEPSSMGVAVYVQAETNGEVLQSVSSMIGPKPTASITTDIDGREITETTRIEGTATGDVQWVEVRIDGKQYKTAEGTGSWSYSLDPDGLPEGKHTLRVRAYSSSLVYSDLAEAEFETSGNLWIYIVILLVIMVVLLLIVLSFRKRVKG